MPTITTVKPEWETGVQLTADEMRRANSTSFLGDGSNNGVRGGIVRHGDNSLAVSVNGSDQVTVQAGACVIPAATGLGVYRASLQAATAATAIDSRNATNPRIDLVVFRSTGAVDIVTGTPGASPSAPALPAQAVELARLNVPAVAGGAVTVSNAFRLYAAALGSILPVETSARLPGSGNYKGQRALALDTGIEHRWDGTAWVAQSASAPVTAVAGTDSSGTTAYRRGDLAFVNVSATSTSVISPGGTLFGLPLGYRPPVVWFDDLVDTTGDVTVRVHIQTNGDVLAQTGFPSGRGIRGSLKIPL